MRVVTFVVIALLVMPCATMAQLSPGDLSKAHATLEGLDNCKSCHEKDRRLGTELCLACHISIQDQRSKARGLHSRPEYRECQLCHVEHQGKETNLIYWKNGMKNFDHATTGYLLDGKHMSLDCDKCHNTAMIKQRNVADKTVNSNKTFLGLDTACASCHFDEHRTQLGNTCVTCHTTAGWKPAAKFDHSASTFGLVGKHQQVECVKCHKMVAATGVPMGVDTSYQQFKNIQHSACSNCHADVHKGTLGANCESCHSPNGWHNISGNKFDHSKTRYPLGGKHALVECGKCHIPREKKIALKFAYCTNCHADFHKAAFAQRAQKGACEECHTVKGFSPTNFTVAQHEKTDYPLRGAHLAIPCVACHIGADASGARVSRFVFKQMTCANCHRDPHNGQVKKLVDKSGCEACHAVENWGKVSFDHNQTKFPLEGKHGSTQCIKCHAAPAANGAPPKLTMVGAKSQCGDCHKDIHRGQFASAKKVTDCKSCHSPRDWHVTTFDHDKASKFHLEGKHKTVACVKCHLPTTSKDGTWVKYKPLETTCVSCHGKDIKSERVVPW